MAGETLLTPPVGSEQGPSTLGILARSPTQRRQRLTRKACIHVSRWIPASHLLTNTGRAQAGIAMFEARIWTDLFFPGGTAIIPIHLLLGLVQNEGAKKIPLKTKRLSQKSKQTQGNSQLYLFVFQDTNLGQGLQSDSPTWSGFDFGFPSWRCTDWYVCRREGRG